MLKPIKYIEPNPMLVDIGFHAKEWRLPYDEIINDINFHLPRNSDLAFEIMKNIAEQDFFFFNYAVLGMSWLNHPFVIARCYEYGDNIFQNGIYLWARDHFKSTVITKGGSIFKEILSPGRRQAIFSLNNKLATKHLLNIKYECETNNLLPTLWPNIFWEDPRKAARTDGIKWTEDGINFKTATSAKDLSIAGFGLIDSMPTGSHFTDKDYDDIIDLNNIGTWAMKDKVLYAINMSDNLGDSHNGTVDSFIGTRYDADDPYETIINDYGYPVYKYPSEVDESGEFKIGGEETLLSRDMLNAKLKKQGLYIYSAQMGQSPINFKSKGFNPEYFRTVKELPERLNYIIIIDGAGRPNGKRSEKDQDFTIMKVYGLGAGQKNYVADIVRDRLTLPEKWQHLKRMHKTYSPYKIYYERYGCQADIEYFELKMAEEDYFFTIDEIYDNQIPKKKRIETVETLYAERKIIYLDEIWYKTKERGVVNLTHEFFEEEYKPYPKVSHDDGLDVDSWLTHYKVLKNYPGGIEQNDDEKINYRNKYQQSPLDEGDYYEKEALWFMT